MHFCTSLDFLYCIHLLLLLPYNWVKFVDILYPLRHFHLKRKVLIFNKEEDRQNLLSELRQVWSTNQDFIFWSTWLACATRGGIHKLSWPCVTRGGICNCSWSLLTLSFFSSSFFLCFLCALHFIHILVNTQILLNCRVCFEFHDRWRLAQVFHRSKCGKMLVQKV